MFPAYMAPNYNQNQEQHLRLPDGSSVSASEFFRRIGGANGLRLMGNSSAGTTPKDPRITWQLLQGEPLLSLAFAAGKDKTGRTSYGAIVAPIFHFIDPESIAKFESLYTDLAVKEAVDSVRAQVDELQRRIQSDLEQGLNGGEIEKKKYYPLSSHTMSARTIHPLFIVLSGFILLLLILVLQLRS